MPESVIKTTVDASQFEALAAKFEEHHDKLAEYMGDWSKLNAQVLKVVQTIHTATAAITAQQSAIHKQTAEWREQDREEKRILDAKKQEEAAAKRLLDAEKKRQQAVKDIWKNTQNIGSTIASATVSILKWIPIGSIFSGLTGGGGLWGIGNFAQGASDLRRQSMSLGVQSAQMQAFGVAYNKIYADPQSMLQKVFEAKYDYAQRGKFAQMGITDVENKDPVELAVEVVNRSRALMNQSKDQSLQFAQSRGLLAFSTMGELQAMHRMPNEEFGKIPGRLSQEERMFQLKDQELRQWQELNLTLMQSKITIENALIKGLAPLTGHLADLSTAIANTIANFLKPENLKPFEDKLNQAIDWVTKTINNKDFQEGVSNFTTDVVALAQHLHHALEELGWVPTKDPNIIARKNIGAGAAAAATVGGHHLAGGVGNPILNNAMAQAAFAMAQHFGWIQKEGVTDKMMGPPVTSLKNWGRTNDVVHTGPLKGSPFDKSDLAHGQEMVKWFESWGWTPAESAAYAAQAYGESNFRSDVWGDKGTAYGAFQLHPDRQAAFNEWAKRFHLPDLWHSDLREQAMYKSYEAREGLRSYVSRNVRPWAGNVAGATGVITAQDETPADIPGAIRDRTAFALSLNVNVNEAPGVNTTVAAGGLTH